MPLSLGRQAGRARRPDHCGGSRKHGKSIAVLPFENLSEDKANGFFADGIQDQILTGLAKIGDLKVISRTSTQKYASRPENLSQIARELGVEHILEGSVQRAGNQVRINVQLIEAGTDSHLWAETYDRSLDDIFAVETEVAQKIAESLAANLSRGELAALTQKPTEVPAAYEAYLKARAYNANVVQTRQQADLILDGYREAVRLDPKFALAWAQLARESFRTGWVGLDPSGKLTWKSNSIDEEHVITVLTEAVSDDYLAFLQALMNQGRYRGGQLLQAKTVALMNQNQIGDITAGILKTTAPQRSNDVDFFPGIPCRWGLGYMISTQQGPNGRSAGSVTWAGIFNTYYWLDPQKRIAGVFLTQILPFADIPAVRAYGDFEKAIYGISQAA